MEQAAHCTQCSSYEERVMNRKDGEAIPDDLIPCKSYVSSSRFQTWAVDQMRKEVMRQVSGAGLDRMAMLKADPKAKTGTQNHQSKNK